jgi:hypothetical protein
MRLYKADKKKPKASIYIAIKVGIHLSKFNPRVKQVKVDALPKKGKGKGRPKKRTFYGTTVKIGGQPRTLVRGAFFRLARGRKELVLGRKKAFTGNSATDRTYVGGATKKNDRTTVALRTGILGEQVKLHVDSYNKYLKKQLDDNFDNDLKDELSKRLDEDNK